MKRVGNTTFRYHQYRRSSRYVSYSTIHFSSRVTLPFPRRAQYGSSISLPVIPASSSSLVLLSSSPSWSSYSGSTLSCVSIGRTPLHLYSSCSHSHSRLSPSSRLPASLQDSPHVKRPLSNGVYAHFTTSSQCRDRDEDQRNHTDTTSYDNHINNNNNNNINFREHQNKDEDEDEDTGWTGGALWWMANPTDHYQQQRSPEEQEAVRILAWRLAWRAFTYGSGAAVSAFIVISLLLMYALDIWSVDDLRSRLLPDNTDTDDPHAK